MLSLEFVLFFHFWFVDEAREDFFGLGAQTSSPFILHTIIIIRYLFTSRSARPRRPPPSEWVPESAWVGGGGGNQGHQSLPPKTPATGGSVAGMMQRA